MYLNFLDICYLSTNTFPRLLPKDEDVCPSSLAKYFHDLGAVVEERAHEITIKRTNRVIPELGLQKQITGMVVHKGS